MQDSKYKHANLKERMDADDMVQRKWILFLIVPLLLGGCGQMQQSIRMDSAEDNSVHQQWGIEPCGIRLSAEGYMLDFRYRVTDSRRAAPLLKRQAHCHLIDQKSGSKMIVPSPPKVGSLRTKTPQPEEGRLYYIMFANPGRMIQKEDRVTVVIDELQIPDLTVQ